MAVPLFGEQIKAIDKRLIQFRGCEKALSRAGVRATSEKPMLVRIQMTRLAGRRPPSAATDTALCASPLTDFRLLPMPYLD